VPLQIKEDLAEGHFEPDRPPGQRGLVDADVAAAAARILVNFEASPHGGHWRPLPDSGREPAIAMRTVIHHSIVGSAEGAFQYFAGATAIESTFIVKKSGYFWQCMSLGEQADANFRANAFAGSIETEDNGNPDTDPWTSAQLDTLVWLSREMRRLRPRIARRKCRTWDDAGIGYHWRPLGLEHLRSLGVLGDKHVPADYLYGSETQRLALLQGLMDTDGDAGPGNAVEFSSTREQLANAVVWLAASLGQRPRLTKGVARLNGIDHGPKYRVTWTATRQVFALARKAEKLTKTWTRESDSRILVRCDPVPVIPMRCLTVDSPNSMYLITDRCLPTHNTCPGAVRKRQWANRVLPRYLAGDIEEDDMTGEQARQLQAVYEALIVLGTRSPKETVSLMFERIRTIEDALIVPGTLSPGEAFDLLFARVRNIAERLAGKLAE
jgi:hypothetical protein